MKEGFNAVSGASEVRYSGNSSRSVLHNVNMMRRVENQVLFPPKYQLVYDIIQ